MPSVAISASSALSTLFVEFEVGPRGCHAVRRLTLIAMTRGRTRVACPLLLRSLLDAPTEVALDESEIAAIGRCVQRHGWPPWIRLLRAEGGSGLGGLIYGTGRRTIWRTTLPRRSTDDLLVDLTSGTRPLGRRLEEQLRDGIRTGRLSRGRLLPSSRSLADQLGVSRGVVVRAYAHLAAEGYLTARSGSGTEVAAIGAANIGGTPPQRASSYQFDFHPGLPDLERFPRAAWNHAMRRVLDRVPSAELGYPDPAGTWELRAALAGQLARSRRIVTDGTGLLITSGFVQAFGLVCQVLRAAGASTIAVEDPGWFVMRKVAVHHGLTPLPVPVDGDGLQTRLLTNTSADAVVMTPAHQYPTGAVLSEERRAELLLWAKTHGALVIEDDYDAEYRYDRRPVGCLQGLAPESVIYIGSASKILAPGLRLGWLVAPERLIATLTMHKALADAGSAILYQLTLADLIESGEVSRHLHRMRGHYRRRRAALTAAVAELLPAATVQGIAAGLHALVLLPADVEESALITRAAAQRIRLEGLSAHRMSEVDRSPGLVLGYGALHESRIRDGLQTVASIALDAKR
jgi:GntR family transcriptional regulator/MocR family aminotransferase